MSDIFWLSPCQLGKYALDRAVFEIADAPAARAHRYSRPIMRSVCRLKTRRNRKCRGGRGGFVDYLCRQYCRLGARQVSYTVLAGGLAGKFEHSSRAVGSGTFFSS